MENKNRLLKVLPFIFDDDKPVSWLELCKDDVFTTFYELYYEQNPAWGSLHIVLSDGNIEDEDIEFCYEWAVDKGDIIGAYLASRLILVPMKDRIEYDFIQVLF